ncbi:MAG: LacI family DNA-binding transcriptional regulator [Niabella sp.]
MVRKILLKDIAEKVGVSTALVSYVLNGKEKEARVGHEIAEKIRKVTKELNYQPNLIARGLKFGKTKTLGLIVADISNPFFSMLARIVENEANNSGYTVIFGSSDEQLDKSQALIDTMLNRQVDGLIVTPVEASQQQIDAIQKRGIPLVLIDRGFNEFNTNTVVINNREATYDAVRLLINNGYRRIGMVAYEADLTHMKDRIKGYKDALKDNKIKFSSKWLKTVSFKNTQADVEKAVTDLLKTNGKLVDALLFATNSISVSALKVLSRYKIKVPEEVEVLCFDESDVYDFFYSPITYIKQDLEAMGKNAVQILLSDIENGIKKTSNKIIPVRMMMNQPSGKTKG